MQQMKKSAVCMAVISIVINLLMLTGPLFMLQVYDRVLGSGSVPTLVALVTIVGVLYAFMAGLDWIRGRVLSRIARTWDEALAPRLFPIVLSGKYQASEENKIFSPLRDLDTVRNFVAGPGPSAFLDAPWVPFYIGVIFVLHALLGWFAVGAACILFALMLSGRYFTHSFQNDAGRAAEASHAIEQEARFQQDSVQAMALYEGLAHKWRATRDVGLELNQIAGDRGMLFSSVTKSARLLFQAGILALGAWLAIHQEITAGAIIASAIILSRGLAPIEQLLAQWRNTTQAWAAWKRLKPLADEVMATTAEKTPLPAPSGAIEVSKLKCSVANREEPLLSNISFNLEAGEGLGVVGPSGSGKSTLLKAMLGIWPDCEGKVRLDGATLDQWDRGELARHIGYVSQDTQLLTGTVAQNISRFLPDAKPEQVLEAAQLAQVHEMIVTLPMGYDTVVGPGGMALSAGQRQRVSLARAFFGRPSLIILDEPNSNLDNHGDLALTRAIRAMRDIGSTVVVASHRPNAITEMGNVLVLRNGRQVAFGPNDKIVGIRSGERVFAITREAQS